jgi:hypothetical protein
MRHDQLGNIAEGEEGHEVPEVHRLVSDAIDSHHQEEADLRTALDSANERLVFYRGLDATFQAALVDATSRAAEIKSKAETQAVTLLKYVHDERTQLEAAVRSLRQYNRALSGLEQVLQAMASVLKQAEEQLEQRMQTFNEAATQIESLRPIVAEGHPKPAGKAIEERVVSEAQQPVSRTPEDLKEIVIEEHPKPAGGAIEERVVSEAQRPVSRTLEDLKETVIEEHLKPEAEAIEERVVLEAQQPVSKTLEDLKEVFVEEHSRLEEEAIKEHLVPEVQQSVSRTWVRIIGLRQIARLHNIESALKARAGIEDVRVVQYTKGVLVLYIGHRSAPLPDIFRKLPGIKVQEVYEMDDGWIEVHLDGANANSGAGD